MAGEEPSQAIVSGWFLGIGHRVLSAERNGLKPTLRVY
jgi:hypothetical protein